MKKQVRIFLAGMLVIVPLAVTVYVIVAAGSWLDGLGNQLVRAVLHKQKDVLPPGLGVLVLLAAIYLVGLMTHVWGFGRLFGYFEGIIARLPGVKVIYESVRDLMKLFGGDSAQLGRAVRYQPPGTDISFLGILTNENPLGIADGSGRGKVAVYLPYAYMFGGPTIYVSPEHIRDVDLSVDQVLKIAATAHVGAEAAPQALPGAPPTKTPAGEQPTLKEQN